MRKTAIAALATFVAILAARPAAALPGFTLAASTPRVTAYTRGPAVDVRGIEASLQRLEGTLGTRLTGRVSYYRYASAQEIAAGTGYYAEGVTFAGQVHSTRGCHDHELVHVIAAQMGDPGRFFQEGLAVALGDDTRALGKAAKSALHGGRPLARFVSTFDAQDPAAAYAVSGAFVKHLIDTEGMDKVRGFYRAARSEASVRGAFTAAFGRELEAALAAWRADL